ncbi:hypothetical protein CWR48_04890 [Oceanobacillus arenosus]|uniref:Uncharacterized protein n=1 Tax=Oceanobacillus arenosus TaxID=1229153 RepID=A0A3D8PVG8_9BACI|nr:hypothetical protein CWR48_04890 [Oceanobacillus arenosus]
MWWNLAPTLIAICSIIISIYVFKMTNNKRYFWSSLTLSGINLLGGCLLAIAINFKIGLILLTIPFILIFRGFYNYKKAN